MERRHRLGCQENVSEPEHLRKNGKVHPSADCLGEVLPKMISPCRAELATAKPFWIIVRVRLCIFSDVISLGTDAEDEGEAAVESHHSMPAETKSGSGCTQHNCSACRGV